LLFILGLAPAFAKSATGTPLARVPDALIEPGAGKVSYILVVEKATQTLLLYEYNNGHYYLKDSFVVTTGERIGDKEKEGDRKTPEGFYIFTNKYIERELAPIYGILAYPMDYPNFLDVRLDRAGNGIWLHGSDRKLVPRDSNGCIALNNIDLLRLEKIIKLWNTPILVYDKVEYKPVEGIREEAARIKAFIESWRGAWEASEIARYRSYYDPAFTSNSGRNFTAWMENKVRLARKYRTIRVRLDNLRIFRHQGLIVVNFTQNYQGDSYSNIGEKRLYLNKRKGNYAVSAEIWKPISPKPEPKPLPLEVRNRVIKEARMASLAAPRTKEQTGQTRSAAVSDREKVRQLIEEWLMDWSAEDQKNYFSHYHPDFHLRDFDLKAYKRHKTRLFKKHSDISIGVRNLKIQVNRTKAEVTFIQDFHSRQYQDRGLKKLVLVKFRNNWRIKEESWQEIRAGAKP